MNVAELEKELLESQNVHQELLDYSRRSTTLILPDMEQACNVPLPAPTPSEFWTEEEQHVLEENRKYFEQMALIAVKAKTEGLMRLPKKPKRKIEDLFKEKDGKKKRVEPTTPNDLHHYLVSNQADVSHAISTEAFTNAYFAQAENEKDIVERLQKGMRNLKRQDAQQILIYIQFGQFLIMCKQWQEKQRKEGRMKETWADWLKAKTGYSDVHARRLRAVARSLYAFPRFTTVGLPISFIMGKLKQIEEMLQIEEYREYWSETPHIPVTSELQQSQS